MASFGAAGQHRVSVTLDKIPVCLQLPFIRCSVALVLDWYIYDAVSKEQMGKARGLLRLTA